MLCMSYSSLDYCTLFKSEWANIKISDPKDLKGWKFSCSEMQSTMQLKSLFRYDMCTPGWGFCIRLSVGLALFLPEHYNFFEIFSEISTSIYLKVHPMCWRSLLLKLYKHCSDSVWVEKCGGVLKKHIKFCLVLL